MPTKRILPTIRVILLLFLVAILLSSVSAGAGALSTPPYQVETATIAGGNYQLTSFGAQADPVAIGGAYLLLGPSAPELQGSGCCCTYLPCILRNK
jgi:hypothetical protein